MVIESQEQGEIQEVLRLYNFSSRYLNHYLQFWIFVLEVIVAIRVIDSRHSGSVSGYQSNILLPQLSNEHITLCFVYNPTK